MLNYYLIAFPGTVKLRDGSLTALVRGHIFVSPSLLCLKVSGRGVEAASGIWMIIYITFKKSTSDLLSSFSLLGLFMLLPLLQHNTVNEEFITRFLNYIPR